MRDLGSGGTASSQSRSGVVVNAFNVQRRNGAWRPRRLMRSTLNWLSRWIALSALIPAVSPSPGASAPG